MTGREETPREDRSPAGEHDPRRAEGERNDAPAQEGSLKHHGDRLQSSLDKATGRD